MTNYPELELPELPNKDSYWTVTFGYDAARGPYIPPTYYYTLKLMQDDNVSQASRTLVVDNLPSVASGAEISDIKDSLQTLAKDIMYREFPDKFEIPFVGEYGKSS